MNHQDEFWQLFKAGELIKLDTGRQIPHPEFRCDIRK